MADDIFIGGKQLSNPRNVQVQADTEAPLPDTGTAVSNPIENYHNDAGGVTPHNIVAGSNEQGALLSDRGAPRDLDTWANQHGELDALDKDKEAWDEEDFNQRGFQKSKLRKISTPTAETHNIVAAPDGSTVAFPKGTPTSTMQDQMSQWWNSRVQNAQAAWDSVRHAATNAAQAIGLPSDMPELQLATDEFMRDPIGKSADVVGAVIGGLAHGTNSVIPNTPENKALVARAKIQWNAGDHLAASVTLTPLIGDGLSKAVKQAQSRDYSGSIGTSLGVAAPFLTDTLRAELELPRSVEQAYAGEERRAGARPSLMSPTEIETAMKNRRLQDIQTPFDATEGSMATINRDLAKQIPAPETYAYRSRSVGEKGIPANADSHAQLTLSENEARRYAEGREAVTGQPQEIVKVPVSKLPKHTVLAGPNDSPWIKLHEPVEEQAVEPVKQTVGTAEGAARDSQLFAQAKEKLGPDASFSQVAREAQRMKTGPTVAESADTFNAERGRPSVEHREVGPSPRAAEIADEYDKLQHNPADPAVQRAYSAMKDDIDDQWNYATNRMGIKMEPWTEEGQPYKNSKEMSADVKNNKHLYFFQGGDMPADHPLAATDPQTGLTYNDKIRAVHDLFGHAANENQFGPAGEERAWQEHRQMFSPEAVPALTTETRGQNSWVNFGKHLRDESGKVPAKGEPGYVPPTERPYAENKAALLPDWTHQPEGVAVPDAVAKLHNEGGGSTYNPTQGDMNGKPSFAVPAHPELSQVVDGEKVTPADIKTYMDQPAVAAALKSDPNLSIGTWAHEGKTYYDLSVTIPDRDEAIALGKKNNQIAIRDLQKGEDISTGGTGTPPFVPPVNVKDLWTDEAGTYTSGQFMKYLAKNRLISKAGKDTLETASKEKVVPGWAEVSHFLTPEDQAQASASVQRNVVDLVNKFDSKWVEDAAKAGSAAKGWYSRATALIQHMFGDEAHRFTNFVASLSPQKDVEQNLTDALNFYNLWQDAGKPLGPENEKVIRDLVERAETGMSGQVARNQLYENLVNDVQPTGPKVSNFARNLKGNMDAVTKDRWMAYLFGNNERMFRWFKDGTPKPAVHLAADALVRAVGQNIGMLPAEVQETAWSFLRTVVNLTEKEKISTKAAVNSVTDELIKEGASELTRLIADSPKVQSALNRLATATGDGRFRADNLQNSPRFKQLLQEHREQTPTAGGIGATNRAGLERGVNKAIEARSELSNAKRASDWKPKDIEKGIPRSEPQKVTVPISDIRINKRSLEGAQRNIANGKGTKSKGPIELFYNTDNGQVLVEDGHHRLAKAITNGEKTVPATIWSGYSDTIPNVADEDRATPGKTTKPAPKKASKDKATEFNPSDLSSNISPSLMEKMRSALA